MIIYVVKQGDTLTNLAREYGVSINNLAADNGLNTDDTLVVGQALVIQIPLVTHTVERGETLASIARRYKTSSIQLLRNNYILKGKDKLLVNQEIVISYENENKTKTFSVNSYAYPYINADFLREQLPYFTYLTPFTYGISENGSLVRLFDQELIRIAKEYSVSPLLHLSTLTEAGNFSSQRASLLFESQTVQDRLIDEIINLAESKGYGGVDVDFEFINPEEKFDYIRFLQELRLRLNALGLPLFSALAPKTSDGQRGVLYEGHDYAGIGAAVNYILLMTYEWGYTFGPPMAVAPLNRVREVVEYALTRVSSSKLFLGIPTYGYDWTLPYIRGGKGAPSISPVEAINLARKYGAEIQYDENAQAPWFRYTDNDGRLHEVWFEDARSIMAKLNMASELSLYGIGYWNAMREFPQNLVLLNANFNIRNFSLE